MTRHIPADLLEIVEAVLPGTPLRSARLAAHGNIHDVVLLPGTAAVRISRRQSAVEAMPRRMRLLQAVAGAGLPFAVPEPLTPVMTFGERAAVAVSWVGGAGLPEGKGDPERIGELLRALREVPLTLELRTELDGSGGSDGWADLLERDVLPRLPGKWRTEGRDRLDRARALEPVAGALVHADLGAENVHWDQDGRLVGVLDWDLALVFDPAIDAACMAWHGWENVRGAVDDATYRRARVWDALFGVEHLVAALSGRPLANVDSYVTHVVAWLERNGVAGPKESS
ncbi:phosphotransferase [Actinoplanes awajinensis]|uniref:Serine kinase n=1 Tax=Actinoplanes awajinensis subsp. mycoplanecinus TaxID=135947 RepID=A0A0X3VB91_9ACTN|nr:phosphotransferase [Actinoplanes awajinensis]KUL41687.1 serine kinase [Actinoplanes awajinensis subsp. mycoplanecinus]